MHLAISDCKISKSKWRSLNLVSDILKTYTLRPKRNVQAVILGVHFKEGPNIILFMAAASPDLSDPETVSSTCQDNIGR